MHCLGLFLVRRADGVEALDDVPAEHLVALLLYVLRESQHSLIPSELYEQVVNAGKSERGCSE